MFYHKNIIILKENIIKQISKTSIKNHNIFAILITKFFLSGNLIFDYCNNVSNCFINLMHIAQYCNSSLLIVFFLSCSSSDAVVNLNMSDYLMNRSEAQSCSSSASIWLLMKMSIFQHLVNWSSHP